MSSSIQKSQVTCPHCGSSQVESIHSLSTFCKACGEHFEIARQKSTPEAKYESGLLDRTLRKVLARPPRTVHCHHCGEEHEVSGHAVSTICPGCARSIEMRDVTITGTAAQPVDTRGKLHVKPKGSLSNGSLICGSALIEGKVSGVLRCEGEVKFSCKAKMSVRLHAGTINIAKGAELEFPYPIEGGLIIVQGKLTAPVIVGGKVQVLKGGSVTGRVRAHAMSVERGGFLIAESIVKADAPELPPSSPAPPVGDGDFESNAAVA